MNEDDPDNQLVRVEHGLALTSLADNRILSEMVGASLVLARDSAVAPVDLDALVREGKRLYCSIVKGRGLRAGELTEEDIQAFNFRLDSGFSQPYSLLERMREMSKVKPLNPDDMETLRQLEEIVKQEQLYEAQQGMREEDIQAFALFCRAAKAGHGEAQFIVSRCYHWGHGVQRDQSQALNWLGISAESGFAEAQYSEAVKWFRRAAEQGTPDSQYELGIYLISIIPWDDIFGEEAKQGYIEGIKWLHKAAEQGQRSAQRTLGSYYHVGSTRLPFSRDILEAYKWLQLAADQGHKPSGKTAEALAATMSPSELEAAQRFYREFKDKHAE